MSVHRTTTSTGRRLLVIALATGSIATLMGCDDDSGDSNIDPIPTDNSVVSSGVPSTDGSTITTPAPNPNAGGGTGSGTESGTAP